MAASSGAASSGAASAGAAGAETDGTGAPSAGAASVGAAGALPAQRAGAVAHTLGALSLLAERVSVGVSEVAAELGVAPSSAHRLLAILRAHGFATQDPQRRYRGGPALARLGDARPSQETLRRLLHPHLVELTRRLGETTHAMVLDGTDVRVLDSVESDQTLRVSSRAGRVLPAHRTSGGKVLLAELGPTAVQARYPAGLPRPCAPGQDALSALHAELALTRRRGYGVNNEESERGIIAVAACVRSRSGRPLAALSATIPAARLAPQDLPRIAAAVLNAAGRASTAL